MSKIFKLIYVFSIIVVLYIMTIFIFPKFADSLWNMFWLNWFNNYIVSLKDKVNNFVFWISENNIVKEKTKEVFELKQSVDDTIEKTKEKIENIQDNVDKTAKSIEETQKSISNTVDSLNELKNSVTNITSTWSN